jgi:hypothetical protein
MFIPVYSSVGETSHFGDELIRALYGLRLPLFSDPEAIIPEKQVIIEAISWILRRRRETVSGSIWWGERAGKRVLVHGRGWVRGRRGAMTVKRASGFYVGET